MVTKPDGPKASRRPETPTHAIANSPTTPTNIEVRGARVHNLKNVDVDIPLGRLVGIAGVSGSGKSSLALGVLYAEGSRRYLEALSTYTRRRLTQAGRAQVDEVLYVPAALALHQRPAVPGVRSTFGTMSELLNSLRLLFSRCGSHQCPTCGTHVPPTLAVAADQPITCPHCGATFHGPGAESLAFNSAGACPTCGGTGIVLTVDESTLVPDETISIDDGAVKPWGSLMWDLMKQICREMGVRTDVPFNQLTSAERDIVFHGPAEKRPMAERICESFADTARRLLELGLGYLSLDRAGATLSTGERQRVQLARSVRNRTTGVLYVLDEPSIGLHPANIDGLVGVMRDLVADGNSVVMVDHDTRILAEADWLVEMGPVAGAKGGHVIAQGTVDDVEHDPASRIGPFLAGRERVVRGGVEPCGDGLAARQAERAGNVTNHTEENVTGCMHLETGAIHTVKPLVVDIPRGRLVAVTGVSGSGKTTLVLESLVPAVNAKAAGTPLPAHVHAVEADGVRRAELIDSSPIGTNVRSTVATYADVHNELRRAYARTAAAKEAGYKAGDFSYNTGRLRCPTCDGTGQISLDVQFLPDVGIPCPDCGGTRYAKAASSVTRAAADGSELSLPQLMAMSVDEALEATVGLRRVQARLHTLSDLGLGYLTLGEATPALSGGEAQRLKLASEMGRAQDDTVFVFDEPTIGLHPLDVATLLGVFDTLVAHGATVVVIEHDLDVIRNADYVIDLGPGGGERGGRIVATGTPAEIAACPESVTGRYL